MTEQEWLECKYPKAMLEFVRATACDRRYRLFAAACCRRVWHFLTGVQSREAVEIAERFADGRSAEEEREKAQSIAAEVRNLGGMAAKWTASASARTGAIMVVDAAGQAAACPPGQEYDPSKWELEWREQCVLLRDIFGNPFQPITINPDWITSTVKALAQKIYEDRTFDQLPLLADELEKAGCADPEILGHCRGVGVHVKGCWVVDLVLGRE